MSDAAMLAAIRAAPDDDAPRLVYADWLEEHGQPERAEFIRVQCQLARHERLQSHTGDEIVALWLREDELLAQHYESITGLKNSKHQLKFSRGFAFRFGDITFFAGRRPSPAGIWTHLLFRFESTVGRIDCTCSAGDLIARARSRLAFASRDTWGEPEWVFAWIGDEFFRENGCTISETPYALDPFDSPPTVNTQDAQYRLTADRDQLHLDPVGAPYPPPVQLRLDPVGVAYPPHTSTPGFDTFSET